MCLCLVVLSYKWLCFWVGDSSNFLWLFKPLSLVAYGNKVVVSRCANLGTPRTKMLCCLPFRIFNVESKCNYKSGNSIVVALRFEETLSIMSIMSPYVLDSWRFVNSKIFFVSVVRLWYHHLQAHTQDYYVWELHHPTWPHGKYQSL
jgi:hypothetical protein